MGIKDNIFQKMIHMYEDEVFSVVFYLDEAPTKDQLEEFFKLMNKCYSSYVFHDSNLKMAYADELNIENIIINELAKMSESYYEFSFKIPVLIQREGITESILSEEKGLSVTIEKDDRFKYVFILDIFHNVFVNNNFYTVFDKNKNKWLKVSTNQKLAASTNRAILSSFLKEIEHILGSEIQGYESLYFDNSLVYKYGFLNKNDDEAVNKNNDYNYYTITLDNKDYIIRISKNGNIHENVSTIEVNRNRNWIKDTRVTKIFMSKYLTGWVTDDNILDVKNVEESLKTGMTLRTIKARNLALEKHKKQKYGMYPYEVHLVNVVNVLLHFGVTFENDVLIMSAWLHDIIEDTDIGQSFLITNFGEEVNEIVKLVSNQNDVTKSKEENKRATFEKIITNQNAIIIKLADRIANVEFSLLHGSLDKITKYKKEQEMINEIFKHQITTARGKIMFSYLNKIML